MPEWHFLILRVSPFKAPPPAPLVGDDASIRTLFPVVSAFETPAGLRRPGAGQLLAADRDKPTTWASIAL